MYTVCEDSIHFSSNIGSTPIIDTKVTLVVAKKAGATYVAWILTLNKKKHNSGSKCGFLVLFPHIYVNNISDNIKILKY